MDKIQIIVKPIDYTDCIFSKACEKYKYRHSEPSIRCVGCSCYSTTIPKIEEIYFEVFQEPSWF